MANYQVEIPGTDVIAYLGQWNGKWTCSLWVNDGSGNEECIATQTYDISGLAQATPEQVARITFLLEVEYA